MHPSIRVIAAAIVISSASPALAQEVRTASVKISPADFATPKARAALDRRVQLAVETVCGVNAMAEGESWGAVKKCQADVRREFSTRIAAIGGSADVQLSAR
ncbi:MAG: UrcA family protein [Pseudomonadota bacterium]|jgi:UrcA family protein